MTKERPILFSGPMVRALLAGTKTQTRRIVKPQPPDECTHYYGRMGTYSGLAVPRHYWKTAESRDQAEELSLEYLFWPSNEDDEDCDEFTGDIYGPGGMECPYGSEENCLKAADRLWVRETWGLFKKTPDDHVHACVRGDRRADGFEPHYRATDTWDMPAGAWRPSIHMPRWACRLELEITGVRVERLRSISEADALAEGIVQLHDQGFGLPAGEHYHSADPRQSYFSLWEAINGPGSVEANPWVWVVEFARIAG